MKITIDTKEDSHEEIKKVIALLTHLIGQTPVTNANIFNDSKTTTEESGNVFSIFDNNTTIPTETKEEEKQESPEESEVQFY